MLESNPMPLSGLVLKADLEVLQTLQNQMLHHVQLYAFEQLRWPFSQHSVNSKHTC